MTKYGISKPHQRVCVTSRESRGQYEFTINCKINERREKVHKSRPTRGDDKEGTRIQEVDFVTCGLFTWLTRWLSGRNLW